MKQEDLLVKVYARSNDQEVKQPDILRLIINFVIRNRPPLILEKTVLFLVHYCLRVCGTNDPRLPYSLLLLILVVEIVLLLVLMCMLLFMTVLKWFIEMQFGKENLHIVCFVFLDFIM